MPLQRRDGIFLSHGCHSHNWLASAIELLSKRTALAAEQCKLGMRTYATGSSNSTDCRRQLLLQAVLPTCSCGMKASCQDLPLSDFQCWADATIDQPAPRAGVLLSNCPWRQQETMQGKRRKINSQNQIVLSTGPCRVYKSHSPLHSQHPKPQYRTQIAA